MPWVNKKPINPECPHKSLPPLRGGVDFAECSVYACDECGEEFVYLIKYDIPVWDKRARYKPVNPAKAMEDIQKAMEKEKLRKNVNG